MCAIIIKRRRRFKSKRRDRDASDKTFVARTFQFHVVLVRCFHHAFPDGRVDGDFLPGLFHEDDANCLLLLLLLRFRRVSAISSVLVVRRKRRRERKARPQSVHVPRRRRHEHHHPGSHNPFPQNASSHVIVLWFDDATKAAAQSRTSAQQAFTARREHRDNAFPPSCPPTNSALSYVNPFSSGRKKKSKNHSLSKP